MTPEMEEVGKILVEAEGGCWHKFHVMSPVAVCYKCGEGFLSHCFVNPDFSKWENFGRVLKIAKVHGLTVYSKVLLELDAAYFHRVEKIDQIPTLVSIELARIIKEEK
jgi:hypothetical protein